MGTIKKRGRFPWGTEVLDSEKTKELEKYLKELNEDKGSKENKN